MSTAPTNDPPVNGPVIVQEVPGYADRLIEAIADLERVRKIHLEVANAAAIKRDRLTEVLQAAIAAEGWDRIYDPLTGTLHHVGYADRRTKAVPLGISVDPCGNSTAVRLSEELKAKVAEILGIEAKPMEPIGDQALSALEQAISDAPPTKGDPPEEPRIIADLSGFTPAMAERPKGEYLTFDELLATHKRVVGHLPASDPERPVVVERYAGPAASVPEDWATESRRD